MCNCGNTITTNTICTTCVPTDCACPIKDFSTDCIQYTGENLPCTEILQGTLMTEVIGQLDTYLCDLSEQLANSFSLISVGSGTRVYRGVDGIGRKEIRSLVPTNSIITIGLSTDDKEVQIGLNSVVLKSFIQDNQITYSASNVGTGAGVYKQAIRTGDNVDFKLRKIKSTQSSFSIVESGDDIVITTDGSETKVQQGSGISVTGIGTFVSPYVVTNTAPDQTVALTSGTGISATGTYPSFTITNTAPDQTVVITGGGATTVTGTYPNFTISSTDNSTTYSAGTGLSLSGTTFSVQNLQKTIPAANYTLLPTDTEYTIFIENGATPITITVPTGLPANFNAGFIQEGTGVVTFSGTGTTINTVNGLKIKGQNYQVFLEKKLATSTFYLLGNTTA